ncbi:NAD(P)/FAD-dependent oxidoreductase [Paenibacillus sp. UNC499MF]|uniref:NAD(P)/FAD-dependent oxidoreductase n=1 Tax=Paenibacillus sp. UNC499MF TaxID=1502751 RepID=UPI0008A06010|nr:FAD-dependent monooxygenase [Paenibacillus sp. UNC499MF]SEF67527.1 Dehydrogenase (flavoprotein) [Paenibacillus sp. UNC499MF]
MTVTETDAAVLGGGLAGSLIAKSLAEKGWRTLLVDRNRFPRHKVCGEFLSPEVRQMLDAAGLTDRVSALRPAAVERVRLISAEGGRVDIPLPGIAMGLSRFRLDEALHEAAAEAGARVRTSSAVLSVERLSDESCEVRVRRGSGIEIIRARTVIAAWGANGQAAVTGFSGPATPGNPANPAPSALVDRGRSTLYPWSRSAPDYMGVKSHYTGIEMEPVVELYLFPGGYLGLCPVEDGLVNASALLSRDAFRGAGKSVSALLEAAAQRCPPLHSKLKRGLPVPGAQAAVAPVKLNRRPNPWDMVPRLGDSSVMIPPLCGDGMSMALRSARLCAPLADGYLRGELSLAGWEEQYVRAVKRTFGGPLRWGRLLQSSLGSPAVVRMLLRLAQLSPGVASGLLKATRLKPEGEN